MKKILVLSVCTAFVVGSSGCGLRNSYQAQKQADANTAAQQSHDMDKTLASEDAQQQLADYNSHLQYYTAIAGDYVGVTTPVGVSADPSVEQTISVHIELSGNLVQFTNAAPLTVDQVQAQTAALAFDVTVQENASSSSAVTPTATCVGDTVKPDYEDGTFSFTCQNVAVGAGRMYNFAIDAQSFNPQTARNSANMSDISAKVSTELRGNQISKINLLNLEIMTPYNQAFFGKLTRKSSSN
jgi:hypothetical protein